LVSGLRRLALPLVLAIEAQKLIVLLYEAEFRLLLKSTLLFCSEKVGDEGGIAL
jgi:hypothetical protein